MKKQQEETQKDDEPPLDPDISRTALLEMAMVILTAIVFLIIGIILGSEIGRVRSQTSHPVQPANIQLIQGNTLVANKNPSIVISRVMASKGPREVEVIISGYNSLKWQTDNTPFITASGTRTRKGIIACNWLPFGTIVQIGEDYYVVEDRMNKRYGKPYIDIWFKTLKEAKEFGRQKIKVKIY